MTPLKFLYFDLHKDTFQEIFGHRKLTTEAHVALIEKPSIKFIGHILLTAVESTKEIAQGIMTFIKSHSTWPKMAVHLRF